MTSTATVFLCRTFLCIRTTYTASLLFFSTNIICAGPSITVNGRKIFAPFDIKAIGPDDALYSNFIASDAYKKITLSELKYDVSAQNDMLVPGFVGNYERDVDMLVGSR